MKNTRNKVRLTESQLHDVIKESVKQVLSELDWKTYASASDKRRKQAEDLRVGAGGIRGDVKNKYYKLRGKAIELDKAASKELSRKFGRNLETWGEMNGIERGVMDADSVRVGI